MEKLTKQQFETLTREYAKAVHNFLGNPSSYFTSMPNGFRITMLEDERHFSISLYQDKALEPNYTNNTVGSDPTDKA